MGWSDGVGDGSMVFGVPFSRRNIWLGGLLSRRIAARLNFPLALPPPPPYWPTPPWACSSVVEHCVDIAGVASSILASPTLVNPAKSMVWVGFLLPVTTPWGGPFPRSD